MCYNCTSDNVGKADCFIEFILGAWFQYTLCIGVRKRTTLAAMQLDDDVSLLAVSAALLSSLQTIQGLSGLPHPRQD